TVPTALGDPAGGVHPVPDKPVLAVDAGQAAAVQAGPVPSYTDPAQAAAVLAKLAERAERLARPLPGPDEVDGIDLVRARTVVTDHLATEPDGGWLGPDQVVELLGAFGLPVLGGIVVTTAEAAASAQRGFGCPVVLKAIAVDLLHKSSGGGVVLDLDTPEAAGEAFGRFRWLFGEQLRGAFVQPMVARGRELLVGVVNDQQFGPLVVTGLGGVDTDLLDDRAAALAPLSAADADDLLHGFRAAEGVFHDVAEIPVRDVLLRVSKLAELVPEIAELDLNPVIATGDRCQVVDARVRIVPVRPVDPFLRGLRNQDRSCR
ncbi:MAG: acetate--CoA ligase family protein, partial [Umezawaea sp.]